VEKKAQAVEACRTIIDTDAPAEHNDQIVVSGDPLNDAQTYRCHRERTHKAERDKRYAGMNKCAAAKQQWPGDIHE
jgi:hypothetical protein